MSLTDRPTVQTALACLGVFVVQSVLGVLGVGVGAFALSLPLWVRPWTLVLATYAHVGVAHLVANLLALVLVGLVVERGTTPLRFHAFFLLAGALAGVAELLVAALFAGGTAVVGASGAVFALLGYALAGNRAVGAVGRRVRLDRSLTLGLYVAVALVLTIATAGPGLALVAHFTGLLLGLLAGRRRLLQSPDARPVVTER
ncbi:rhomboid family intramembrane serine protease [Salinirubellus salinus]|uniref:Rhomboid family intramembrane serine protease n=1 Tax=Salinirubellus salinus TaxID=1364945 RepID=A0A9E7R712_9EURY|nr:rhomboid family intramembrane serine protease [Salinirubellus salinus]UWM56364.1 rhomboid family intramembrane serine protease [Salinirubellus salinus]